MSDKYGPDGGNQERMYCSLETEGEEVLVEKNGKQFDLDLDLGHDPNGDDCCYSLSNCIYSDAEEAEQEL